MQLAKALYNVNNNYFCTFDDNLMSDPEVHTQLSAYI